MTAPIARFAEIAAFAAIAAAFGLMLAGRLRADVAGLAVALVLGLTGLVTPEAVFSGFSSPAVVTIVGISILAQALQRTGVTQALGRMLSQLSRGGEGGMIAVVMGSGAFLSLFMNNIAAAAVLLPSAVEAVKRQRLFPSRVMLPLAFGTELGGMATLLTTGNLVVSAALTAAGLPGYGLLDFAPVGVPVTLAGMVFMLTVGRRLLPKRDPARLATHQEQALADSYELLERLNALRVLPGSPLAGTPILESRIGDEFGMSLMAVVRNGQIVPAPKPSFVLQAGDVLLVIGRRERADQLLTRSLERMDARQYQPLLDSDAAHLVEVMLAPRSRAVGQTLKQLRFREKFGATVLALWHGGRSVRTDLAALPLAFGDSMLVYGSRESIQLLQSDPDYLVLRAPEREAQPRTERALVALLVTAAALAASAAGVVPTASALMLGALAVVVSGCLTMDEAYRAVEWRAVFLIAGMTPLAVMLTETGIADTVGRGVVTLLSPLGSVAVGAGLMATTALLAQVMSGQVTAVVLAPIAISAAEVLGRDPRAVAMFVALGSSLTFITPNAHPVNAFVMGVGGYTAADYPRVGLPLTLLAISLGAPLTALVWRL
ncbi:MAG: SLC13 family permease [Thermoflexales bacterium]|nr:SLC13 family permease [Thermoflexales bacterium]